MTPDEFASRLEKAAARVPKAMKSTTKHEGQLLRALIQANASGAPGPNVVTGAYLASWQVVSTGDVTTVGTEAPQGRRLEFGFVGTDSLGRTYDQHPRPHVGLAVGDFQKRFGFNIKRAVGEAMS
ncbi:HK97 gp10 family phage protein [Streptomyces sp. NBC_01476]|uniref:HK97 gp10 family phage protein n=1 Tax=Streptomyces sp. NBC_01476 TaxID=2903881 RepID=UPI002E3286B5|nr:HK97 gp10 family phage protein [Streptomyces sp. NBC_01476]